LLSQQTVTLEKNENMKKLFAFAFLGIFVTALAASCGSSKGGNCDAYGNKSGSVEVKKTSLPS
jgi:hypothetical protein